MSSSVLHNPQTGFNPDEEEIIEILKQKNLGKRPANDILHTLDSALSTNPHELPLGKWFSETFLCSVGNQCFFFNTRPEVKNNTIGISMTKDGYWCPTLLRPMLGHTILKRVLTFYWGSPPNGVRSRWTIVEYSAKQTAFKTPRVNGDMKAKIQQYSLCKLCDRSPSAASGYGYQSQSAETVEEGYEAKSEVSDSCSAANIDDMMMHLQI